MAISIEDIKKLRAMTGAGLADVKKALTEAEGDFAKAKELLRERGLAIAAKRSDRETSNGCVLVQAVDGFAAMIALKCETDFVANGADFIALTKSILEAAIANKCKTLDEVKELALADGQKVQDAVKMAHEREPGLLLDGELQADAALIPSVTERKAPGSPITGKVNTLVFPSLEAGNIGYKLVQRFSGADAYGPILQGFAQPISDLSRGCSVEEIVVTSAITLVQAGKKN